MNVATLLSIPDIVQKLEEMNIKRHTRFFTRDRQKKKQHLFSVAHYITNKVK